MTVNLDDLTIGQARQLAAQFAPSGQADRANSALPLNHHLLDRVVLVRTYSAGVHYGTLKAHSGTEVLLLNARRIWSWEKAFTLSKIATAGVGSNSKLSVVVPEILLTEAIEIILVGDDVARKLDALAPHSPE